MANAQRGLEYVPGWGDLQQVLDELCSTGAGFEQNAAHQLDQCDNLRLELENRCRHVEEQQRQLQYAKDELEFKWKKLEELRRMTELGAQQVQDEARRLSLWHSKLAAGQPPANNGESGEANPLAMPALFGPDLSKELSEAHQQIARLADAAAELAGARRQLVNARAEVVRLRHRLAAEKGHFSPNLKQQVDFLNQERQRLLVDLESARRHATELQQAERATWLEEIRALREVLDEIALSGQQPRQKSSGNKSKSTAQDGQASLDRLIAQFDQLQNQLKATIGSDSS